MLHCISLCASHKVLLSNKSLFLDLPRHCWLVVGLGQLAVAALVAFCNMDHATSVDFVCSRSTRNTNGDNNQLCENDVSFCYGIFVSIGITKSVAFVNYRVDVLS
jgi:hypothetical protein